MFFIYSSVASFTLVWEIAEAFAWPDKYCGARRARLLRSYTHHSLFWGINRARLSHSLQRHWYTQLQTLLLYEPTDTSTSKVQTSIPPLHVTRNLSETSPLAWISLRAYGTNNACRGYWQILNFRSLSWAADWRSLEVLAMCQVLVWPLARVLRCLGKAMECKMFDDAHCFFKILAETASKTVPAWRSEVRCGCCKVLKTNHRLYVKETDAFIHSRDIRCFFSLARYANSTELRCNIRVCVR